MPHLKTDIRITTNQKKKLLLLQIDATCFGRVDDPHTLKYVILMSEDGRYDRNIY